MKRALGFLGGGGVVVSEYKTTPSEAACNKHPKHPSRFHTHLCQVLGHKRKRKTKERKVH
jgi:hypothetical protein